MFAFARRRLPVIRLVALAGLATIALAGCGDGTDKSRLLSHSAAADLRRQLANVDQLVADGECDQAKLAASEFEQRVTGLRRLDRNLREVLTAGGARLQTLVETRCEEAAATGPSGPTGTAPPPEKAKKNKAETPGKGKGKGQEKHEQNGTTGEENGGGVETPTGPTDGTGPLPGGTTP